MKTPKQKETEARMTLWIK